ncbi:hypothetical protein Tco_0754412 [Tanacetum coccineum]
MSKLMYTRFTKLIIDHFLTCNESILDRSDSKMHSEGQDLRLIKLKNTIKGDQEANFPNAFKKNVVPRKTRSLTVADNIVEEPVVVELVKSISIDEQRHQQRAIMSQLITD